MWKSSQESLLQTVLEFRSGIRIQGSEVRRFFEPLVTVLDEVGYWVDGPQACMEVHSSLPVVTASSMTVIRSVRPVCCTLQCGSLPHNHLVQMLQMNQITEWFAWAIA